MIYSNHPNYPKLLILFNRNFIFRVDGISTAEKVKVLILGDSFVGKTSLLRTICKAPFTDYYIPTICENTVTTVEIRSRKVWLPAQARVTQTWGLMLLPVRIRRLLWTCGIRRGMSCRNALGSLLTQPQTLSWFASQLRCQPPLYP